MNKKGENSNILLIVAVVLGVFLFSGGLTGNLVSMPTIKPITQTSMMAPAIQTKPVFNPNIVTSDLNNLKASYSTLKTNTWNQYVSLVQEDAKLDYRLDTIEETSGLIGNNYGCTCICGEVEVYAWGRACTQDCPGASGGGTGGGGGGGSAICDPICQTVCSSKGDKVIKALCEPIC